MTVAVTQGPRPASSPSPAGPGVAAICDELARLRRLMAAPQVRSEDGAGSASSVVAHSVLRELARTGAVRQGALAEALHSDASTVSRQVAALVERDLVRRAPDARDGRACLLEITPGGTALLAELQRRREERLGTIVRDWTPAERSTFADLLHRLVDRIAAQPAGGRTLGDDTTS